MKGDKSRPAVVYLVTNIINGKRYIGVTADIKRRMREHFSSAKRHTHNGWFHVAIRKYGRKAFITSILSECNNCTKALTEEIRLISELKPEYNATLGGDGRLGGGMTPEGRARVVAANTGKCRHHMPHSNETKARLREIGLANKDVWAKYAHLGPKASAKCVICLDDLKEFESASAAARHYGVAKSTVIEICLGKRHRKTIGGMRFSYVGTT